MLQESLSRKKMKKFNIFLYAISFLLVLACNTFAGWELYDDFNSGSSFETDKWSLDTSSANISIENGEAKFVHLPGRPNDSSWLILVKNPKNIVGIRAKVRVQSYVGDVRGRIAGYVGKIGENSIWSAVRVRPSRGRAETYASILAPNDVYLNDLFFGTFKYNYGQPANILNKNYILEWYFSPADIAAKTYDQGEIIFEYEDPVSPSESSFKGLGTRSIELDGACTLYFDDVYVYRKRPSPATNLLLLGNS
jgi:hypothetical protein